MVVSGINHGANMGDDTIYSGIVAAATEGFLLGIPSIAISLASKAGGIIRQRHGWLQIWCVVSRTALSSIRYYST